MGLNNFSDNSIQCVKDEHTQIQINALNDMCHIRSALYYFNNTELQNTINAPFQDNQITFLTNLFNKIECFIKLHTINVVF